MWKWQIYEWNFFYSGRIMKGSAKEGRPNPGEGNPWVISTRDIINHNNNDNNNDNNNNNNNNNNNMHFSIFLNIKKQNPIEYFFIKYSERQSYREHNYGNDGSFIVTVGLLMNLQMTSLSICKKPRQPGLKIFPASNLASEMILCAIVLPIYITAIVLVSTIKT
uniref:Uncharacterized protein n=1 Tax=Glossina pallidipes TaxID=7398 RepID=A0A1B0A0C9_GLOPL